MCDPKNDFTPLPELGERHLQPRPPEVRAIKRSRRLAAKHSARSPRSWTAFRAQYDRIQGSLRG